MTPRPRIRVVLVAIAIITAACASAAPGPNAGDSAPSSTVAIRGTDTLRYEPTALTAAAGTVTFELTSEAAAEHTLVIEELGDVEVVAAAAGASATGTVELEPGTYTFYCSVPGHRAAGMEGQLRVSS